MQDVAQAVDGILLQFADAHDVSPDSEPTETIIDSLDQLRFIVALEEHLGVSLDGPDVLEQLDLTSRDSVVTSVEKMLDAVGVERTR